MENMGFFEKPKEDEKLEKKKYGKSKEKYGLF